MALAQLTPQDVGAPARDKINAAINEVNGIFGAVQGTQESISQLQTALANFTTDVGAFNKKVSDQLQQIVSFGNDTRNEAERALLAIEDEARARAQAVAAGFASALQVIASGAQPGVVPDAFSNGAIGAIGDLPPLDPAAIIASAWGPAWQITGAALIAPRVAVLLDIDAIWIVQARFWRQADVLDPNNNAVDLGIQWLDRDGHDAGTTLLERRTDLTVQDGPQTLTFRVPSLRDERPRIVPPASALSWRPFLRVYGSDGATAVALLGARDATFAGVYAPDVTAIAARLRTLEGQLAAGFPVSSPILPSAAVADLPPAGNRGRKYFALNGRAPDAAGNLEAANAGTGVEVTDNGAHWVITGTNQQVQA